MSQKEKEQENVYKNKRKHKKQKKKKINIAERDNLITPKDKAENTSKKIPQEKKIISADENKKKENLNENVINKIETSNDTRIKDNSLKDNGKRYNLINNQNDLLIQYLNERKLYYSNKKYSTPILDKIIRGKIKITLNSFITKIPDKHTLEPYYPNLIKIIEILNSSDKFEKEVLKKKRIGYICHKNKDNHYIEGIYSDLDNLILYQEIADKSKFEKDNIYNSDPLIADNCFKARGLSLEFYINYLLMNKFKQKGLPRVIYHFLEDGKQITKLMDLEELDGVFYLQRKESLEIKDLPFIVDDILEADNSKFDFTIQNNDCIQFNENSLVLLEVKNRFPGTMKATSKENIEKDLKNELIILCDKVLAFYELYNERYEEIKKIRIILFYDVIPKTGYDIILSNTFKQYFNKEGLIDIKNKIQFQFTFILSSYFAYTIQNLSEKINLLEMEIIENKSEMESLKSNLLKIINEQKKKIEDQQKKIDDQQKKIDEHQKDIKTLKDNLEIYKKDNELFKNTIINYKSNIIPKLENEAKYYQTKYLEFKKESAN